MQWFRNFHPDNSISISDRGLSYGDGLFETLFVQHGVVVSLTYHIARLKRGCFRLGIKVDEGNWSRLFNFVQQQASLHNNCGIKIILTRGEGGRGYLPPEPANLQFLVGIFERPDYQSLKQSGVHLVDSPIHASINRSMSGLKHLNRLENVLAKQVLPSHAYEAVMYDDLGHIVECIQSNLFWVRNGILYTSMLNRSGVQGTFRSKIFSCYAGVVSIGAYHKKDLLDATEIFVTNALSGVIPVTQYGNRSLAIGAVTQKLMSTINKS